MGPEEISVESQRYQDQNTLRVLVASDPGKVASAAASLNRKRWEMWKRVSESPKLTVIRYYPYHFQSWKVTAPKTLGRTAKVLLLTGVNGMSRSVGPASEWPIERELQVEQGEIMSPQTSEEEATQLAREYVEKLVMRRYRPSQPPRIRVEQSKLIYVPYYVYARKGEPLRKAVLIEGFTGAVGKVKDVTPVLQTIASGEL